jgi:DNA-binding PadR family transcriptional regulator
MTLLTRTEEIILLAIWRLKDNAYGVTITDMLTKTSGRKWVLGGVYVPLDRMEKKGYIYSHLGKSTKIRGGRSKRLYKLTRAGLDAMIHTKTTEQSLWKEISIASLEKGYEN